MHAKSTAANSVGYEGRVLVVDDEWAIRDILQTILVAEGYEVDCAENGESALAQIGIRNYDVLVSDLQMPGMGGEALVERCREMYLSMECIVTTGAGASEAVQTALRIGAFEAVTKPFHFEQLKSILRRARQIQKLRSENEQLQRQINGRSREHQIIGHSEATANLRHILRTVAETDTAVLVIGESGSGRELAAREIHRLSTRRDHPFIHINCTAIPENTIDAELFGSALHELDESSTHRPGWLELAKGGMIYLEEIGDLNEKTQIKLLRAIETRQIFPLDTTTKLPLEARIIASTSRDLDQAVAEGRFRADLYYRLNVIPIRVPALRERREDIPLLVAQFAEERSQRDGRPQVRFSAQAMACLVEHDWPGNLRELMNFVERMAILHSGGEVEVRDLPDSHKAARMRAAARSIFEQAEGSVDFNHLVDEYERALIDLALRKARGVKNHAASLLRLKRTTLVEKMKKKKIEPNHYADFSQSGS